MKYENCPEWNLKIKLNEINKISSKIFEIWNKQSSV